VTFSTPLLVKFARNAPLTLNDKSPAPCEYIPVSLPPVKMYPGALALPRPEDTFVAVRSPVLTAPVTVKEVNVGLVPTKLAVIFHDVPLN